MGYDKDWEVHLALNDPNDPIHGHIEEQLEMSKVVSEEMVWKCEDCDFSTSSEQAALAHSDKQKHSLAQAPLKNKS